MECFARIWGMELLFNQIAYPIVTSEEGVIAALEDPKVRAAILRDETQWQLDAPIYKAGIAMETSKEAAQKYHHDPTQEFNRKKAGNVSFLDVVKASDIMAQAAEAEMHVDPVALELLTRRNNELRALHDRVHDAHFGKFDDQTTVGHAMFTPKGGLGRATMMHVDDVRMTMHTTFAGASLRLLNGITTDKLWDLMDHQKMSELPQDVRDHKERELTLLTQEYNDEFSSAPLGDIIFMKGQKGLDITDRDVQSSMAVHASSPFISFQGQAAAIFYSKKTLDIG